MWSHFDWSDQMPNQTFFNLPDDKRQMIVRAAMEEFSKASYSEASTNQICKKGQMAKGSFYQYFQDKQDLYDYVMTLANSVKIEFFAKSLEQLPNMGLLDQVKLVYVKGVEFARKHPMYAALGDKFSKETDEAAKSAVLEGTVQQAGTFFEVLIQQGKSRGEIVESVSTVALAKLLQTLNQTVYEHMLEQYGSVDYEHHEKEMHVFVEELLDILANGVLRKDNRR